MVMRCDGRLVLVWPAKFVYSGLFIHALASWCVDTCRHACVSEQPACLGGLAELLIFVCLGALDQLEPPMLITLATFNFDCQSTNSLVLF
jgi:hypothetical protein